MDLPVAEDKKASELEKERLEWIDTFRILDQYERPLGLRDKVATKIKENPLVPIGMLATLTALSFGIYSMYTGNTRNSQLMMRSRVVAQGFTIAAILIGITISANKNKPQ